MTSGDGGTGAGIVTQPDGSAPHDAFVFVLQSSNTIAAETLTEKMRRKGRRVSTSHAAIESCSTFLFYKTADQSIGVFRTGSDQYDLLFRMDGSMDRIYVAQIFLGDALRKHEDRLKVVGDSLKNTIDHLKCAGVKRPVPIEVDGQFNGRDFRGSVEIVNPLKNMFTKEIGPKLTVLAALTVVFFCASSSGNKDLSGSITTTAVEVGATILSVAGMNIWRYWTSGPRYVVRVKL